MNGILEVSTSKDRNAPMFGNGTTSRIKMNRDWSKDPTVVQKSEGISNGSRVSSGL